MRKTSKTARQAGAHLEQKAVPAVRIRATLLLNRTKGPELKGIPLGILGSLIRDRTSLTFEALISENAQVVTCMDKSKPVWTAVHRGAQGGSFWDHSLKAFADFTAADMPAAKIRRSLGTKMTARREKEQTIAEISFDDPTFGPTRHEAIFSHRPDLAPFGAALYRALHCGPNCHKASGLPYEELTGFGFVVGEKTFFAGDKTAFTELQVTVLELGNFDLAEFRPPAGFVSLKKVVKAVPVERPDTKDLDRLAGVQLAETIGAALAKTGGYEYVPNPPTQVFTPDCMGSTRFGSMAATVHHDFVDHASSVANTVAPLLGVTTITAGTWNVPWLASLASIRAVNPAAPGSGLFCLLRDPRIPTTASGGPGGGTGLLDRIAWRLLTEVDGDNRTRTQREFREGTLEATLFAWGITAPTIVALFAASGDMRGLIVDQQIEIVEGFETEELGMVNIRDLPTTLGPFSFGSITLEDGETPVLMNVSLADIRGVVDFTGLAGAPIVTAANIGGAGNIVLGLRLPTITLSATITRALTEPAWVMLLGGAVMCLVFPWLCPLSLVLAVVLLVFVLNNVTAATALCTGVTLALDIRWRFDADTERVEPFVTILASGGNVALTTSWVTPNIIANVFDSMVSGLLSLFNAWLPFFAEKFREGLQAGLRRAGLQLPVRGQQLRLRCVGGGATSNANALLQLRADVQPRSNLALQPYVTQVSTAEEIEAELFRDHFVIRRDLNPQPAVAPGPSDVITAGTYFGLGLSQNVLNYYLFSQWSDGGFQARSTDVTFIRDLLDSMPQDLFPGLPPYRVHMWAATPPRIETTPAGIVARRRPFVVFFDDVRACLEFTTRPSHKDRTFGAWELSFNLKTEASIVLGLPFAFRIEMDDRVRASEFIDNRTWEFVDSNVLDVMNRLPQGSMDSFAEALGRFFLRNISVPILGAPPAPRPWGRRTIAMQQEVMESVPESRFLPPQQIYLELLHRRKALNVLPVVDTTLLELVDGSGAPRLNAFLRTLLLLDATATVTIGTMTCGHGVALRNEVVSRMGLPQFP